MKIRKALHDDLNAWVALRHSLWPNHGVDELKRGARQILESDTEECFLAIDASDKVAGFIEGAVHPSPAGPYCHVEGWYVLPECRRQGYGKKLMGELELWSLHQAIVMLTSDTDPAYSISPVAHEGCGFRQIHELKIFLKELPQENVPDKG